LYLQARKDALVRKKFLEDHPNRPHKTPETNQIFSLFVRQKYNLKKFMEKHPGGKDILKMTAGLVDATLAFESYRQSSQHHKATK